MRRGVRAQSENNCETEAGNFISSYAVGLREGTIEKTGIDETNMLSLGDTWKSFRLRP